MASNKFREPFQHKPYEPAGIAGETNGTLALIAHSVATVPALINLFHR